MQEHIIHKWKEEDGLLHNQLVKMYQSKIEKLLPLPEYKRCGTCDFCVCCTLRLQLFTRTKFSDYEIKVIKFKFSYTDFL